MGIAEEMLISGIAFAMFCDSDILCGDFGHGHDFHCFLRFRGTLLVIFPLEPGTLLAVISGKHYSLDLVFDPSRLLR
ncbi:MAG: hypothetical protein GYA24_25680 [Candidatus Lokiarchaeota archaeon]|nr:hypothetical protein [Candidatus Lokiarchaeota archaeon]